MPSVVGLVTEGDFDICAYSPLIWALHATAVDIQGRPCHGPILGKFPSILRELRYQQPTIDKAIVVSDAHGKDPTDRRQRLQQQTQGLALPFPVEYVVVVQELEAILLSDPHAIEAVCATRGRAIVLPQLTEQPDLLPDPKVELVRQLALGGVVYTKVIAQEIARHADLERLAYWSPSFVRFRAAVTS